MLPLFLPGSPGEAGVSRWYDGWIQEDARKLMGSDAFGSKGTGPREKEGAEPETRLGTPWNVVVHDDPVTLMVYVTRVFMTIFGYSPSRAYRLMMEVHTKGRSVVWTGPRERAEVYLSKLHAYHLLATLERAGE